MKAQSHNCSLELIIKLAFDCTAFCEKIMELCDQLCHPKLFQESTICEMKRQKHKPWYIGWWNNNLRLWRRFSLWGFWLVSVHRIWAQKVFLYRYGQGDRTWRCLANIKESDDKTSESPPSLLTVNQALVIMCRHFEARDGNCDIL